MDLFFSLATGNSERVDKLITNDTSLIHKKDCHQRSPLFYPIIYHRKETLIRLLSTIKHKCLTPDLDHTDCFGLTIYDYAHHYDSTDKTNYMSIIENLQMSKYKKEEYEERWKNALLSNGDLYLKEDD
jgi:hypothetical protein